MTNYGIINTNLFLQSHACYFLLRIVTVNNSPVGLFKSHVGLNHRLENALILPSQFTAFHISFARVSYVNALVGD